MLPYLWQKQFHWTIKVCGGPVKLYLWWKISSLHYIWCFPLKIPFVNGDKSAGICRLVWINEWNSQYKGKHHTLWKVSLLYQLYMLDDNLIPGHCPSLILNKVQTTHLFRNPFVNKKIKIFCYASLRSSRLAVFLNIFWNFSQSILMELY